MNDLFQLAPQLLDQPGPLVMVTLVRAVGSSYRKPGARMVFNDQQIWGLVSGGCIEQEVARRCRHLLEGPETTHQFELDTRKFLGCDGRLTLQAERINNEFWQQIQHYQATRQPVFALTDQQTRLSPTPQEGPFQQLLTPQQRLLCFGSGPDVEPLLELARVLKWEPLQLVYNGPVQLPLIDPWTACVVMNHQFGKDAELLKALWNTETPYLGLLGSRKRRDQLLEQLAFELDLDSRTLHAPVGLKLGGEGPEAIALEICAQVQQVMAGRLNHLPESLTHDQGHALLLTPSSP